MTLFTNRTAFLAGAAGAVGRVLSRLLVADGWRVVGMTRSPAKAADLAAIGVEPAIVDAFDRDTLVRVVTDARPDVVVHQLTDLAAAIYPRHFERDFANTNRLRTEATRYLLAAAEAAGARRLVTQSFAGWPYARTGGPVKTEADPFDPAPWKRFRSWRR